MRGRRIAAGAAAVLFLTAGAGCGVLPGDADPVEAESAADLPDNPSLSEMTFPKPESVGFTGGGLTCAALNAMMRMRGYVPGAGAKGTCAYVTPGVSLVKDGAKSLSTTISFRRGAGADAATGELTKRLGVEQRQKKSYDQKSHIFATTLDRFPAGEEGFIGHLTSKRRNGKATALFRSGADLMEITVSGYARGAQTVAELEPAVTYREITDILKSINGQGGAGAPQITPSPLRRTARLAGLPTPRLPRSGSAAQVCAVFGAAERLGTKPSMAQERGSGRDPEWQCSFGSGTGPLIKPAGYVERRIEIQVARVTPYDGVVGSDRFGSDLRIVLRNRANGRSPLYALPVGDNGYAVTYRRAGRLRAAFTVGGSTYVRIDISGSRFGPLRPLPERRLLADLVTVLKGTAG